MSLKRLKYEVICIDKKWLLAFLKIELMDTNKLKDAGYITLSFDLVEMDMGGNDSWSDVQLQQ